MRGKVYFVLFSARNRFFLKVKKTCEMWFDYKEGIETITDIRLLESVIAKNNPSLSGITVESYNQLRTTEIYEKQEVFYGEGQRIENLP